MLGPVSLEGDGVSRRSVQSNNRYKKGNTSGRFSVPFHEGKKKKNKALIDQGRKKTKVGKTYKKFLNFQGQGIQFSGWNVTGAVRVSEMVRSKMGVSWDETESGNHQRPETGSVRHCERKKKELKVP